MNLIRQKAVLINEQLRKLDPRYAIANLRLTNTQPAKYEFDIVRRFAERHTGKARRIIETVLKVNELQNTAETAMSTKPPPPNLTGKQLKAVKHILAGKSDKDVAKSIGVLRETVTNWRRQNIDFKAELARRRQLPEVKLRHQRQHEKSSKGKNSRGLRKPMSRIQTGHMILVRRRCPKCSILLPPIMPLSKRLCTKCLAARQSALKAKRGKRASAGLGAKAVMRQSMRKTRPRRVRFWSGKFHG